MNWFLLLGIIATLMILIPITISVDAQPQIIETSTYEKEVLQDGQIRLQTFTPRIWNGNQWQDYIFIDNPNSLEVRTDFATVRLDKNTCGFTFVKDGNTKFTDSITPYSMIVDSYNWVEVTQITDAVCQASWDGSELVATKSVAGIGVMQYKYIYVSGVWKTQLEATNLTSLTNRVFGFDQTIDLNRDTVFYGGNMRNLDNYDGQTFNRTWLENNEGKVIEFLNGYNFDFDIGFEYLDSITVIDSGPNSSKLVFHYMRNNEILQPGQTLIIDPTITNSSGGTDFATGDYDNNNQGPYIATTSSQLYNIRINEVSFWLKKTGSPTAVCTVGVWSNTNAGATKTLEHTFGTIDSSTLTTSFVKHTFSTGSYVTSNLDTVGIECNGDDASNTLIIDGTASDAFDSTHTQRGRYTTAPAWTPVSGHDIKFEIIYNESVDIESDFTNLGTNIVGDVAAFNGTITITNGENANVTSVITKVNGTTINTNSTGQNSTSTPYSFNVGPIWFQMDTDDVYVFEFEVSIQNQTDTVTNSSSINDSREYAPNYFIADVASEGLVNYTTSRSADQDDVFIKVNRDQNGATFNVECLVQTQNQAIFGNGTGTWFNMSGQGYYNRTATGFSSSHLYGVCYNDNQLFTFVSYTNSSLALLGIEAFDTVYGDFIGVPVGIFFLVLVAAYASPRTAPIWLVVVLAMAGVLAATDFITLSTEIWALALVAGILGLFVGRKFF